MSEQKLRVWWIPEVPKSPFTFDVGSLEEGVRCMQLLAEYDWFQFFNGVKPSGISVSGLQVLDEDGYWTCWRYEDEDVYFDDPKEYLAWKQAKEKSQ